MDIIKNTLYIKNIGLLQTPVGSFPHKGQEQGENLKLENASIFVENGLIKEICADGSKPQNWDRAEKTIDAGGNLVTPGLVEGHTHIVFGGYRQNEIHMKLRGADYLEIHNAGGGIHDTVRKTRAASFDELYEKTWGFLDEMMSLGVTTCEGKSGYGLDRENEEKQLRVMEKLNKNHKMDIVPTFMGAHAVPEEYKGREDEFIELLCEEMLPKVKAENLAEYVDIFCEDSVFDVEQSKKYLSKSRDLGLGLKIHADEIKAIGGSQLAGEMQAVSAEHLIAVTEEGMHALAKGGTVAMLLPATSFYLGKTFAPARRMIELGIPVAMATDFNPGSCPSLNIQFVMNLGYLKYRLTPEEILTAVTINSAAGIGRVKEVGSLEVGKKADLVIWNAPNMEMLCYRFGSNLAGKVIKAGELVFDREERG